jgi:histidinol phosphatase-like PHP family hydrolase
MEKFRADFHLHSFYSDGELLPSEIVRRTVACGHKAIAITDHADASNLEFLLEALKKFVSEQSRDLPLKFFMGVELTHLAPRQVKPLAEKARKLGAQIVVVHGETIAEPVEPGINQEAVTAKGLVDILAHPGLIKEEEAGLAAETGVFLEITSRSLHNVTNGHVVAVARKTGALLLVNTDGHGPGDFLTFEKALEVARGAGLSETEAYQALVENPKILIKRIGG